MLPHGRPGFDCEMSGGSPPSQTHTRAPFLTGSGRVYESDSEDSYTRPLPDRIGGESPLGRLGSSATGERDVLRLGGESSLLLGRGLEDLDEADEADKGETDLCRPDADLGGGEASSSESSSSCRFLALSASLLASSSSATPFLQLQLAKTFT